jgi:hypothetical protein
MIGASATRLMRVVAAVVTGFAIMLSDRVADRVGMVRVIDESGEDYLYPRALFSEIRVPPRLANALASPTQVRRPPTRTRQSRWALNIVPWSPPTKERADLALAKPALRVP